MKKPELMAPAGNWTMLRAAVDAGADAVYFGVKKLNMRANAQNFSLDELQEIVDFCHEKNVRAYLTINTIVFEDELDDVKNILKAVKKAGIDMVICWDLCVVEEARRLKIPICMSTQASISNSSAIEFYKQFGVKRVVLARECSLNQIKEIKKKTKIEIEVFIHGAMCISISGRCFLSHHAFGLSANRGECQQPCRSEYEIYDPDRKSRFLIGKDYVMSAKDLCSIEFIDKLIELGIDSFKIEGRKRSPEYVFKVVSVYRKAIDLYFQKKLTDRKKKEFLEELKKVYNRGFSTGFFFGKPSSEDYSSCYGSQATEHKEYIGKIINFYKNLSVAQIKLEAGSISVGDRIYIQGPDTGLIEHKIKEILVDKKKVLIASKGSEPTIKISKQVKKGDLVFVVKSN